MTIFCLITMITDGCSNPYFSFFILRHCDPRSFYQMMTDLLVESDTLPSHRSYDGLHFYFVDRCLIQRRIAQTETACHHNDDHGDVYSGNRNVLQYSRVTRSTGLLPINSEFPRSSLPRYKPLLRAEQRRNGSTTEALLWPSLIAFFYASRK